MIYINKPTVKVRSLLKKLNSNQIKHILIKKGQAYD